jgi:hypothetical protein
MHCVVVLCAENCPLHVAVSNSSVISNRYIVVYNKNATDDAVAMHQASVMAALRKWSLEVRGKEGKTLSGEMDAFSMSGWRGMSLETEDAMIFFFFSFGDCECDGGSFAALLLFGEKADREGKGSG